MDKAKPSGRAPTGAFLFVSRQKGSKKRLFYYCRGRRRSLPAPGQGKSPCSSAGAEVGGPQANKFAWVRVGLRLFLLPRRGRRPPFPEKQFSLGCLWYADPLLLLPFPSSPCEQRSPGAFRLPEHRRDQGWPHRLRPQRSTERPRQSSRGLFRPFLLVRFLCGLPKKMNPALGPGPEGLDLAELLSRSAPCGRPGQAQGLPLP
jgi:hypothetical protein